MILYYDWGWKSSFRGVVGLFKNYKKKREEVGLCDNNDVFN